MHYYMLEDKTGDLVDLVPFCSDYCHQDYCRRTGKTYEGWNGCQEGSDYPQYCNQCGELVSG